MSILKDLLGSDLGTKGKTVPNEINADSVLAIIGEAPGTEEVAQGRPFMGASGRFLWGVLKRHGYQRQQCFVGNVCQHQPRGNEIKNFKPDGPEMLLGRQALQRDLAKVNPRAYLLLGNTALQLFRPGQKVSDWRGTIFRNEEGVPCVSTYHPAAVLRDYSLSALFDFDVQRAVSVSRKVMWQPPQRTLNTASTPEELVERLSYIRKNRQPVALDIEGGVKGVHCISFATTQSYAFIVPFTRLNGTSYWEDQSDEAILWRATAELLADPLVPKILQNSLYDNFVLSYVMKIPIVNVREDTMLKHWELYSELPKSLGCQASLYTEEPFYKAERKSGDLTTYFEYCCKDSAVTFECCTAQQHELEKRPPSSREHYLFNIRMLRPLLYMELRGIRYDEREVILRRLRLEDELATEQKALDKIAGRPINIRSPKFKDFLYTELGLPKQYKKTPGGLRLTSDYEALLKLTHSSPHPAVSAAMRIARLRTYSQMLAIEPDEDGRIRCGYNVVGTETGRLTCYTSPTGSGYNLQTIPDADRSEPEDSVLRDGLRILFTADPGYHFFQLDLAGADLWTVAAHCASLGDSTLLQDLLSGVKPAKVLALALKHGSHVINEPQDVLLNMQSQISKSDWQYFACKIAIHGSNYLMGPLTLSRMLFKQSEGEVLMSQAEVKRIQTLYFLRYPGIKRWHQVSEQRIKSKRSMSASGHTRIYFNRTQDTLGEYLANEPQENTTYATNMAMLKLWDDPKNRRSDSSLIIQPLHQVHDAICGQFPTYVTEWACSRLRSYFDNEIVIAGVPIKIPFEGGYGPSWGQLSNSI